METIIPNGRLIALQSGANVVMPNVSDVCNRKKYEIYPNKAGVNDDELEEVHSRSEELTLTFQVSKTNLDIDRFSVNTTTYCGTVNYTMSGALFFLDSSSTTFNLTIINVGLENSQIIIDLYPQANINGVIRPIDKTTIN